MHQGYTFHFGKASLSESTILLYIDINTFMVLKLMFRILILKQSCFDIIKMIIKNWSYY